MQRITGLLTIIPLAIALSAGLDGCAVNRPIPEPPKIVHVAVATPTQIPQQLLAPLPIAKPTNDTCGEATRVAKDRATQIEIANSRFKKIKDAQDHAGP